MKIYTKAFIYGIKFENKVVYVGQTTININKRFAEHIALAYKQTSSKTAISSFVRKHGSKEEALRKISVYEIERLTNVTMKEIDAREVYWISVFNTYRRGLNNTIGGNGVSKFNWNDSRTIKKLESLWNSNDSFRKISKEVFGCDKHTLTTVYRTILNKTDEEFKQREHRLKTIAHKNENIQISIYDKNGTYLKEAESVSSFVRELISNGITERPFKAVCSNIRTTIKYGGSLYGYRFSKSGEPLKATIEKRPKFSKTKVYDTELKTERIFASRTEASVFLGVSKTRVCSSMICNSLIGNRYQVYNA